RSSDLHAATGRPMCLIILSWRTRTDFPLILAANRDEFYDRPSLPADFWPDHPDILGGRDLKEGGTWLGITRKGRIAALTNYRDPLSVRGNAPSRGWLVRDFLTGRDRPGDYLERFQQEAPRYNGFSVLLGDGSGLYYLSNRGGGGVTPLAPGIHGLSNHLLDTPWPKVGKARERFRSAIAGKNSPRSEDLFDLLTDSSRPEDGDLPETGIDILGKMDADEDDSDEEEGEVVTESDSAIMQLVNKIINDAYTRRTSDIHIEPNIGKKNVEVRFRVDGDCTLYQTVPFSYRAALISRIKIMSNLDITIKRLPQDGKIKFRRPGGGTRSSYGWRRFPPRAASRMSSCASWPKGKPCPWRRWGCCPGITRGSSISAKSPTG
ncbi:MAG: hypothetical protein QG555_536, partial [Thermodesulfobacteriota bacterium]|nr:hypothetical protein [Thermodesulfobacteriota bacterium]